jgi:uncharacterized SAM-dependent methyltransferase
MNQHLLLKAPAASIRTATEATDVEIFSREAIDLFTKKRQGHLIHRMYMNDAALGYWSEFMKHDGYYVTRSELSLIRKFSSAVGQLARNSEGVIGIENGPGTDSAIINKSAVFFSAIPGLHTYVGRDWSPAIIHNISHVLTDRLVGVRIVPDLSNFLKDDLPIGLGKGRKVMAEFGITRGNMEGFASDAFPTHILETDMAFHRSQLNVGDLYVMTFDANQDKESVEYAYSSPWLTEWGRELFHTMKAELQVEGDFDPESFDFVPVFHAASCVNTNNMVASRDMDFSISGECIKVSCGDAFAITNSYKTPIEVFNTIARKSKFDVVAIYQDPECRMTMPVLRAA